MDTLVAIIVTYNRLQKLQTAVDMTLQQDCEKLIVINNHSNDGTQAWLDARAEVDSRLCPLHMPQNLGGAGGFETGLRYAIKHHDTDWLVCFDDDAYPHPDAFARFLQTDLAGVDAAAAAVYQLDGAICEMNRPGINPFWSYRHFFKTIFGGGRQGFHIRNESYTSNQPTAIDTTSFVGFFVRTSVVKDQGFPDKKLFIYGDDVLYTVNLRKHGKSIYFLPWVNFTHTCNTFDRSQKIVPMWKIYYTCRNGLEVYRTIAGAAFWMFFPLKLARWIYNARLYDNKKQYFRILRMAISDYLQSNYHRSFEEVRDMVKDPHS